MNQDDITKLAQEAGAEVTMYIDYYFDEDVVLFHKDELARFAALVAAAEREACIELTDSRCQCAWVIKARGEK